MTAAETPAAQAGETESRTIMLRTESGLAGVRVETSKNGREQFYVRKNGDGRPLSELPQGDARKGGGWEDITGAMVWLRDGRLTETQSDNGVQATIWSRSPQNPNDTGELPWPVRRPIEPNMATLRQMLPIDSTPRAPTQLDNILLYEGAEDSLTERAPETIQRTAVILRRCGYMLGTATSELPVMAVRQRIRYATGDAHRDATFDELWVDFGPLGWQRLAWNAETETIHLDHRLKLRAHDSTSEWTQLHG